MLNRRDPSRDPTAKCPLWAKSGHRLFDHLVNVGEQRRRHRETEHFRRPNFIPGRSSQCRDPEVKHWRE